MPAINLYSFNGTVTASGESGDLDVGGLDALFVDMDVTDLSGTTPTIAFTLSRKDAAGVYHTLYADAAPLDAESHVSKVVGIGQEVDLPLGSEVRLSWAVAGTGNPSATFSASIVGQ